jgi:hypothetical protein
MQDMPRRSRDRGKSVYHTLQMRWLYEVHPSKLPLRMVISLCLEKDVSIGLIQSEYPKNWRVSIHTTGKSLFVSSAKTR